MFATRRLKLRRAPKIEDSAEPIAKSGEELLLLAMLERALKDAAGVKGVKEAELEHEHFRDARRWLHINSPLEPPGTAAPFSFQWTCETLGLDAAELRAFLARCLENGDARKALQSRLLHSGFKKMLFGRNMKG